MIKVGVIVRCDLDYGLNVNMKFFYMLLRVLVIMLLLMFVGFFFFIGVIIYSNIFFSLFF